MTTLDPTPRRNRRRRAIVVLLLLVAAGAAAAGWRLMHPREVPLERGWAAAVFVLAGDGIPGWRDGDAGRARFSDPFDVAIAPDGTIYVADAGAAQRIRAFRRDGRVVTLAGGVRGFSDGAGASARFDTPSGLAVDVHGVLYVADTGNNAIRRISPDGQVSTLAGDGTAGYRDGPGSTAQFSGPMDVAVDAAGRILVADAYNDRIRSIAPDGTVSTVAGIGLPGFADGPPGEAMFDTPCGVAVSTAGTILVADTGNGLVRAIGADGKVSTPAGSPFAALVRPIGIAAGGDGEIYVTDDRGRIVEIQQDGNVRTVAGGAPGFGDGDGSAARFRRPSGIAWGRPGYLIVADAGNALLRAVVAKSRMDARPPGSPLLAPRFDADEFRLRPLLWPVAPMDGPYEIAGTLGESRGSEGSERFHAGIDIRVPEGTPVVAVRDDVVVSPVASGDFGSLNEWLRIGTLAYVHVRAGRTREGAVHDQERFVATYDETGRIVRMRVRRGARFSTGEPIASANGFNHVHLNVGWPGEEHNPLHFRLTQFEDTIPPTIPRGGVRLFDESLQPLKTRVRGRVLVSGRVQVVVEAWDQVDGNRASRRLGLFAMGYQILNRDGSPAPGFESPANSIRFDQLAVAPDAARLVYAPGSGIPHYGQRVTRFLYIVTNTFRDGIARPGHWDTALLPPGDYIVRALASDIHGNVAIANRDLPVTIASPAAPTSQEP